MDLEWWQVMKKEQLESGVLIEVSHKFVFTKKNKLWIKLYFAH